MNQEDLIGITALLVHVARIDENYTAKEQEIIKKFINSFSKESDTADNTLQQAETLEANSIQLLGFTNKVKEQSLDIKKEIIEHLWKIIISDENVDHYESNLMRRICGLI
ncbi:MAG: TerB family tellurite resistance protein, partial [Pelagibacteraceae bacterium]